MKQQGDFFNLQQMNLNSSNYSNFSSLAEKNIIISSNIIKKHELEKEQKLKEQEKILIQMKNLQTNGNKVPTNSPTNFQTNQTNSSSTNSSQNSNIQIPYNSQLNMSGESINNNNNLYQFNKPPDSHFLSQMTIYSSKHFASNGSNFDNNINQQFQPRYSLSKAYSQINIGNKNDNPLMPNNIPQTNNNINLSSKELALNFNPISSNSSNIQKEQKQKKNLLSIKAEIVERHGVQYTNYFEYPQEKKEKFLNQILVDINLFGDITKKQIEKEKKLNSIKYISFEEAMSIGYSNKNKMYKNEYFVLAVLSKALNIQGCSVIIERNNPQNEEDNKEIFTTVQFLANGLYNFKKYIFYFDFGQDKNNILFNDLQKKHHFNLKLKIKLQELFNIKENDLIICNRPFMPYSVTAIIKKSKFNEYSKENLLQQLKMVPEFSGIKYIQKSILLSGCKLNPFMLDSRGNNKDGGWGNNEIRGGKPYYPPNGWVGYGLRIADRFDNGNNSWIDYNHSKGEWNVAYHGIKSGLIGSQLFNSKSNIIMSNILIAGIKNQFKNHNDIFHIGQKVGEGVIVTPNPKFMEQYCGIFDCCGRHYKIGFMTRVMPKKIRCPEGQDDYWIINGIDNEIRPYRILIKEL